MRRREYGRLQSQVSHAVGTVFVALATLVLDHIALDVESLLVKGVEEEAHPVGFEPEGKFEVVGGHVYPIVRPVGRGGAVEVRADLLQRFKEACLVVLRAFEHHMLEEVGETCASRLLVLGANVIPDVDCRDGQGVVFVQDYIQAVGQGELVV